MDKVADVMTSDVEVIDHTLDVHELEKLLLRRRIHGVPVVDADRKLIGVISQTDLLAWHYMVGVDGATFYDYTNLLIPGEGDFRGLKLSDIRTATVDEIMSPLTYTVRPEEPVSAAAALMMRHRIHRLVVVDAEARVLGIVSAIDLLRAVPGVEALAAAD